MNKSETSNETSYNDSYSSINEMLDEDKRKFDNRMEQLMEKNDDNWRYNLYDERSKYKRRYGISCAISIIFGMFLITLIWIMGVESESVKLALGISGVCSILLGIGFLWLKYNCEKCKKRI
jgi:hypothetical protein